MDGIDRQELERAARRIMEMNERARSAVRSGEGQREVTSHGKETVGKHEKAAEFEVQKKNVLNKEKAQTGNLPSRRNSIFDIINFKGLAGDSDRTLLAGIMLLIGADAADEKLMLALIYIML